MQDRLYLFFILGFFSFNKLYEAKKQTAQNGISYLMSQIFDKSRPPIVLYLDGKPNLRTFEDSDLIGLDDDDYDDDDISLRTTQNDERAYILYHILRTTLEDEDIDPAAAENLIFTKELLRRGFRARCKKLYKCMEKCPPKITCPKKCREVFDDLNACDVPKKKKCQRPKCGKTMPPSWLLK